MKHLDLALLGSIAALAPGCFLAGGSDDDGDDDAAATTDPSAATLGGSDDTSAGESDGSDSIADGTHGDDGASDEASSGGSSDAESGSESGGEDGLPSAAAIDLAVGRLHACALVEDGSVRCWGYSDRGQLGNGAPLDDVAFRIPVAVTGLDAPIVAIDGYFDHTCALTDAGAALCWGANESGQLGDGGTGDSAVPVAVTGGASFTAISAGVAHTCAITQSGGVQCWGHNDYGQLGDDSIEDRSAPVDVVGLPGSVVAISAGRDHTCAVTGAGELLCWGGDTYGELGNGDPLSASHTPVTVELGTDAVDVAAGDNDTCAITSGGAAWCWGKNGDGQLGNGESGTLVESHAPTAVVGLDAGVTGIEPGHGYTCAVAEGAMLCWGDNFDGTLGNGEDAGFESPVPVGVTGQASGAAQIGTCSTHACGRTDDGAVWCWGGNDGGELGDGTDASSTVPVAVVSLP